MVVAPLSANTLAKMVGGLCDNLLLSTMRAWDASGMLDPEHIVAGREAASVEGSARKKIVLAPAMNTAMWYHPVTRANMALLEGDWSVENGGWIEVLRPVDKGLACGDVGSGAMKEWADIVVRIEELFGLNDPSKTSNN
jgi:phosphopantothenoylcysteine decarboxylase